MTAILLVAVALTRYWIRLPFERFGMYRWRRWTSAEKWFTPQILVVALPCFIVPLWAELSAIPEQPGWIQSILVIFVGQMIWGFYQEFLYRGLLQTELVRLWGTVPGILASNLFFTFGPLHTYHFRSALENPLHLSIFLAIFAVGLYFAALFHRSGNLWIVGALHGLGDFFMDGLAKMN